MITKILWGVAGTLWGVLVFSMVLQLTFPGDLASQRLNYEVDELSDGAWRIQSQSLTPWRLSGAQMEGLQLFSVPRARRGEEPVPSLLLQASSAAARLQLLPLVGGAISVAVDADLYDGDLTGTVGQDGDLMLVDLTGDGLDLNLYPFGGEDWGLDAGGRLDLRVDMTHDGADVAQSEGEASLTIDGLTLSNIEVMGFSIDQVASFSEAVLELKVKDGKATVRKGTFDSDLLEIELDGYIKLDENLGRSGLKLEMLVKILDENLDQMAGLAPNLKRARDDEGRYHFVITGTLERPRFREDRVNRRGNRRSSSDDDDGGSARDRGPRGRPGLDGGPGRVGPGGGPGGPMMERGGPDMDDEERQRLREERLQARRERRERMRAEREADADDPPLQFDDLDEGDDDEFLDEDFEDDDFEDALERGDDEYEARIPPLPDELPYIE